MNITIFGGTGKTGQLVVRKALNKGYSVTVFARSPSKISIVHDKLKIMKGEINDYQAVGDAIKQTDIVISMLGPVSADKGKGLPIMAGFYNILKAMNEYKVNRLIATSTPSFEIEDDQFQFSFVLARLMVKTVMNNAYQNIVQSAHLICNSKVNWTIVRLPMLSDKPGLGRVVTGFRGDGMIKLFSLRRDDLADFLLSQIDDTRFIRKAPIVSN